MEAELEKMKARSRFHYKSEASNAARLLIAVFTGNNQADFERKLTQMWGAGQLEVEDLEYAVQFSRRLAISGEEQLKELVAKQGVIRDLISQSLETESANTLEVKVASPRPNNM